MPNKNLNKAKKARNDEFYTQIETIAKELAAYIAFDPDAFRDKTVLCPCDDPEWSNFTKYFIANFKVLGLKKLISTCYTPNNGVRTQVTYQPSMFDNEEQLHGKKLVLEHSQLQADGTFSPDALQYEYLKEDGDFLSNEVTVLKDEADVIVTNPPFSKLNSFIGWAQPTKRKVAILGTVSSVTYKNIFPLLQSNQLWIGKDVGTKTFYECGKVAKKFNNTWWYTNFDYEGRNHPITLLREYVPSQYVKYDNFNALHISEVSDIPDNYDDIMSVPLTYIAKHCSTQFKIVGIFDHGAGDYDLAIPILNGETRYKRIAIQRIDS